MWIEVLRSGEFTDSKGERRSFSERDLAEIAAKYNANEDETRLAPVVKGHPESAAPAYGWVRRLARRGSKLLAEVRDLSAEFLAELRAGAYKKVSVALGAGGSLRHLGFLGAAQPAVDGLKVAEFDSGEAEATLEFESGELFTLEEYEFLKSENERLTKKSAELESKLLDALGSEFATEANAFQMSGNIEFSGINSDPRRLELHETALRLAASESIDYERALERAFYQLNNKGE